MRSWINRLFGRNDDLNCDQVMELLQSYLDDESSSPEEARKVARHLQMCPACDKESQVYKDIKASLAARQRPVDPYIIGALRQFGEDLMTNPAD